VIFRRAVLSRSSIVCKEVATGAVRGESRNLSMAREEVQTFRDRKRAWFRAWVDKSRSFITALWFQVLRIFSCPFHSPAKSGHVTG